MPRTAPRTERGVMAQARHVCAHLLFARGLGWKLHAQYSRRGAQLPAAQSAPTPLAEPLLLAHRDCTTRVGVRTARPIGPGGCGRLPRPGHAAICICRARRERGCPPKVRYHESQQAEWIDPRTVA